MSHPNKAKGTRWETDILTYWRDRGFQAVKPRAEGVADIGDIHVYTWAGVVVVQAKNWASWADAIREGLDGAVKQAAELDRKHNGPSREAFPVAVVKRARRGVGEAYVVTRLEDFVELLRGG
jgi:hypothetical protein